MQEIQGNINDVLSRNYLIFGAMRKLSDTFSCKTDTWLLKYKNTTGRNNQRCSRLNIKHTRFFDSNDRIVHSPQLLQRNTWINASAQKPEKESLTPPPPLNPAFLNPPPSRNSITTRPEVNCKRRRIQFLNHLDDHNAHAKQLRKRSRHKKFRIKPHKSSMGKEDED